MQKKTIRAKNNRVMKKTKQFWFKNEIANLYTTAWTTDKKYSFYVNVCHKATLDIIEFRSYKVTDEFIFRYEKKNSRELKRKSKPN